MARGGENVIVSRVSGRNGVPGGVRRIDTVQLLYTRPAPGERPGGAVRRPPVMRRGRGGGYSLRTVPAFVSTWYGWNSHPGLTGR
jgi:hypothetical protein